MGQLAKVIDALQKGFSLPPKYCDHPLKGQWEKFRACHIEPNWVLIYLIENRNLTLTLVKTGSHPDCYPSF